MECPTYQEDVLYLFCLHSFRNTHKTLDVGMGKQDLRGLQGGPQLQKKFTRKKPLKVEEMVNTWEFGKFFKLQML